MSARSWQTVGVMICVICFVTLDAQAALFRCERSDGSVVYTDSQSTCPGARPHEPRATVQSIDVPASTRRSLPASAQQRPTLGPGADARAEAHWRKKKQQVEQELGQLTAQTDRLDAFLTICNRGGYLFMTQDNGLKKKVSCNSLRANFAELESRRAELHEYHERGLQDECRRTGCLPGWLR